MKTNFFTVSYFHLRVSICGYPRQQIRRYKGISSRLMVTSEFLVQLITGIHFALWVILNDSPLPLFTNLQALVHTPSVCISTEICVLRLTLLKWNQFEQFCLLKEQLNWKDVSALSEMSKPVCLVVSYVFMKVVCFIKSEIWRAMWSDTCLSCSGVTEKWSWRLKLWMMFCTGHNWISSQKPCWWV